MILRLKRSAISLVLCAMIIQTSSTAFANPHSVNAAARAVGVGAFTGLLTTILDIYTSRIDRSGFLQFCSVLFGWSSARFFRREYLKAHGIEDWARVACWTSWIAWLVTCNGYVHLRASSPLEPSCR